MNQIKKIGVIGLVVLCVITAGTAYYYYGKYAQIKKNPQKITQEEVKALVARVGELMVLPTGEEPTVATVQDPEKLKDQAFFAKSKKGDRVLIYTTAKRAILYDPVVNKIVDVAPVNIGNPPAASASSSTTPSTPTAKP